MFLGVALDAAMKRVVVPAECNQHVFVPFHEWRRMQNQHRLAHTILARDAQESRLWSADFLRSRIKLWAGPRSLCVRARAESNRGELPLVWMASLNPADAFQCIGSLVTVVFMSYVTRAGGVLYGPTIGSPL